MKSPFSLITFFLLIFSVSLAWSLPLEERIPASGSYPLEMLSAQPDKIFVPTFGEFKDKYMFVIDGTTLNIIDLETWDTYHNIPDAFSSEIVDVALLGNGTSLIIALSNGNLARIELDDEDSFVPEAVEETTEEETDDESDNSSSDNSTSSDDEEEEEQLADSREINVSQYMTSAGLTAIATNPETTAETVYMINASGKYFYEFNIATRDFSEIALGGADTTTDETTTDTGTGTETTPSYTPANITFANASNADKILITTNEATVLVLDPGADSFSEVTLTARDENESAPTLAEIALTHDENYAYIIDSANDFLWVYSVQSGAFVDQTSAGTSLDPIEFDSSNENDSLTDVAIFHDTATGEDYAYVSGSLGLSLIDASQPGTKTSESKIIDIDDATTSILDPITLSSTPGPLAAASSADGYLYSANGDASVSVLTDNPFVTISSISNDSVTQTDSTFNLTFQSEDTGTYVVKSNSDPTTETGTTLIAETALESPDNDITTGTIDINSFDRDAFIEGENKIFVFVTNGDGLTGRDAILLNVDRPPGSITILAVDFGNKKAYVTFDESEDNDIANYTLYADLAENQTTPTCPGSLTFDSATTVTETVSTSACNDGVCESVINSLSNDTYYCIAIRATDEAGQVGTLSGYSNAVRPEATVGPARFMGETGCSLVTDNHKSSGGIQAFLLLLLGLPLFILRVCNSKTVLRFKPFSALFFFLFCLWGFSPSAFAEIPPNPEHFTLELRAALWIPTRSTMRNFFSTCCNPEGEIEFGYLLNNRFNFTATTGFTYLTGRAIGINNGLASGDKFQLMLIPLRADFIYRHDVKDGQPVVPFVRAGFDSVFFRESSTGEAAIMGNKFGVHGGAGLAVLLDNLDGGSALETSGTGINDVYFVAEARYAYINSFRSTGLDLSGFYPYAGVMFQF